MRRSPLRRRRSLSVPRELAAQGGVLHDNYVLATRSPGVAAANNGSNARIFAAGW